MMDFQDIYAALKRKQRSRAVNLLGEHTDYNDLCSQPPFPKALRCIWVSAPMYSTITLLQELDELVSISNHDSTTGVRQLYFRVSGFRAGRYRRSICTFVLRFR